MTGLTGVSKMSFHDRGLEMGDTGGRGSQQGEGGGRDTACIFHLVVLRTREI